MVEAVVEYDYTAQELDELTIQKGDVIRSILQKKGGWWEGTLRDKRGMFPDNFVTVIQKEHKVSLRSKPSRTRQCRAIFSYHPAHDDELSLSVGDVIDVVCEVEEGWWKGRLGTLEGVFPSNFVAELGADKVQSKCGSQEDLTGLAGETEPGSPTLPPKPTRVVCQVKYPYDACNDDELTLRDGDFITLISKDGQDRGWWRGELHGRIGVFPDNFVSVLPAPDQNGPEHPRAEKKACHKSVAPPLDDTAPRPANVASQRKSLEAAAGDEGRAPPVPGKKPSVPKKSPGPALASLKQKLVDLVDGQAGSRPQRAPDDAEYEFDQVERSALLSDMRANRAKAPGRRPPSVVYRESEPALLNGNAEHTQPTAAADTSTDEDDGERKPKVREWERHKAPWVEELKLNQAKRTPPLTPGDHSRLKLTPSPADGDECKPRTPFTHDKDSSPVDMSRSLSALGASKLKTPTGEGPAMRMKPSPPLAGTPVRPQSIHGVTNSPGAAPHNSASSPSPSAKPPIADKAGSPRPSADKKELAQGRQYVELQERVQHLEARMQQQLQDMQTAIRELEGRLQVETDMRRLLQAELEKVAQCVTQV